MTRAAHAALWDSPMFCLGSRPATAVRPCAQHQQRTTQPTYEQRVSPHGYDCADDKQRAVCHGSKLGQCQSWDDNKQGIWVQAVHDTRGVCGHPCLGLADVREVMAAVAVAGAGCATCG